MHFGHPERIVFRYAFLLSRIPDADVRRQITTQRSWPQAKLALAKELAVRRMAEILTQARGGPLNGAQKVNVLEVMFWMSWENSCEFPVLIKEFVHTYKILSYINRTLFTLICIRWQKNVCISAYIYIFFFKKKHIIYFNIQV